LQQDGFGLVVEVVGGEQDGGAMLAAQLAERTVTQLAGAGLHPGAPLRDLHPARSKPHAERACRGLDMRQPGVGVRAQAVVHVEDLECVCRARGTSGGKCQQDHRIEAAAAGNADRAGGMPGAQRVEGAAKVAGTCPAEVRLTG
jgi:hypothetical protein